MSNKFTRFALGLALIAGFGFTLAACDDAAPTARATEQVIAQQNQAKLTNTVPIPKLGMSQERENLVRRAETINVQNLSSCVTLFFSNGAILGSFPVDGKVSSLNSYLLSGEQIVDARANDGVFEAVVVEQPDIDGAYGKNAEGIFFFTADTGAYVEWSGTYFWSDQCLFVAGTPLIVQTEASDDSQAPVVAPLPAGAPLK